MTLIARILMVVISIRTIYYFVTHRLVEAKCIEYKRDNFLFHGAGTTYNCTYEYYIDAENTNELCTGEGVSFKKPCESETCKIFVNTKKPERVEPLNGVVRLQMIALILLGIEVIQFIIDKLVR